MAMIFCRGCGKEIHETAASCPHCGAQQNGAVASKKSQTAAFLWTIFLGQLGAHRFYLGQIGFGLLYLCTFGLLGVGAVIDAFRFAFMSPQDFADKYNRGILGAPLGAWAKVLMLAPLVLIVGGVMLLVGGEAHKNYEERKASAELTQDAPVAPPSSGQKTSSSKPTLEIYKVQATGMNYRKAMFNEYRRGDLLELVGVVAQVVDKEHIVILTKRDELLGYTDDRVMVSIRGAKVLENDMVKIYARYNGTFEYETVLHVNAKVPEVSADYLDVIGQQG